MYIHDNLDAYEGYEAEKERFRRLRKRKQIEYEKEECFDERLTNTSSANTRNDTDKF